MKLNKKIANVILAVCLIGIFGIIGYVIIFQPLVFIGMSVLTGIGMIYGMYANRVWIKGKIAEAVAKYKLENSKQE